MTVKINNITIEGIRGVKTKLELPLNGKSVLLYGDNGTGKSSISDTLEWFYTDKVSHLSSSEIDLKDALKNSLLNTSDTSQVSFDFSESTLSAVKSLVDVRGKLTSQTSNNSDEFSKYLQDSNSENLLLRYQYLTNFIDNTKGEKLKYLSDIIGYSAVTKTKDVLRKSYNAIKSEIKNQNFESQISTQKQVLIEKLGASVTEEENLFKSINEKVKPLKLDFELKTNVDVEPLLKKLKQPINKQLAEESKYLDDINLELVKLYSELDLIDGEYKLYFAEFEKISKDVESVMQTFLGKLLQSAQLVIDKKFHKIDNCPLCLNDKSHDELSREIQSRLTEIEAASQKLEGFNKVKNSLSEIIKERIRRVDIILANKENKLEENTSIYDALKALRLRFEKYKDASEIKVTSGIKLPASDDLKLNDSDFMFQIAVKERQKAIQEILKENNMAEIFAQISGSFEAFKRIKEFEQEKAKLEKQRQTLELIYNEFVAKQKKGLEEFISAFSGKINEYYQYMNPDEPFQELQIITIGEDDELNGITIQYKYNGNWVSPPQKYFSESHLNCFGISFFLASVDAFNNTNKFILLDDVISSFDSAHRKRFAELLFEKFPKHQFIVLTHEWDWYSNMVKPLAKKKGWLIKEINWSETKGTHFDETPSEQKEFIEHSIAEGKVKNLGNPLRQYLEGMLKNIAINIDAKMSFRYNENNEHRMPNELLMGIRSEIKKCSSELKLKFPIFDRIESSSILGNICSHDNTFNPSLGDLKAFWADIHELNDIFSCPDLDCKKPQVSLKNYDTVTTKIRCGCDKTKYVWKSK